MLRYLPLMLRYLPLLLTSRTTRHLTTSTSVSLHPSLYLSSPRRSTSFPLSNRSSSTHPTRSRSLALSLPRIPTCARYTSVFLVYIAECSTSIAPMSNVL